MSVPTMNLAARGKASSIARPKRVPLPTDVRPTTKPPTAPIATATIRSLLVSRTSPARAPPGRMTALATKPRAPTIRVTPSTFPCTESTLSPYVRVRYVAIETPTSDIGALPSSIQDPRRARTVPRLRCRTAPNDLKTAPCKMSVPIATVGSKLKRKMRIGVISEPPPIPVIPTRIPMRSPATASRGSFTPPPDPPAGQSRHSGTARVARQ
jgi:hypothetical protein